MSFAETRVLFRNSWQNICPTFVKEFRSLFQTTPQQEAGTMSGKTNSSYDGLVVLGEDTVCLDRWDPQMKVGETKLRITRWIGGLKWWVGFNRLVGSAYIRD